MEREIDRAQEVFHVDDHDPAGRFIAPAQQSYPFGYERAAQLFDSPNAPDLAVSPKDWCSGAQPGTHGALHVRQSRAPLWFSGPGVRVGRHESAARAVDIAPTCLAALGFRTVDGTNAAGEPSSDVYLARQDGRPLVEILEEHEAYPSALPARREVDHRAWVTIQIGCDNSCAFCIVPQVRGAEVSRRMGDVVREIEELAANGVSEVTLLGQNVNSYGRDLGAGQWRPVLSWPGQWSVLRPSATRQMRLRSARSTTWSWLFPQCSLGWSTLIWIRVAAINVALSPTVDSVH